MSQEKVEHVLAVQNKLGEGPVWDSQEQVLYWVNIKENSFYRYYPKNGELEMFEVGLPIGTLAVRAGGKGLIMATKNGFALWDWATQQLEFIANPEADKPGNRFNDGTPDSEGRFWAGTMEDAETSKEPQGSLYRLDPDGSVHKMETDLFISNGLGWSPDNRTMYLTDSPRQTIFAYDFDAATGTISNRRLFIQTPDGYGFPDGMTVDSEGYIWSAMWGGWKITRFDPDGKIEREIAMPVECPSCCVFGGENLDELYITSAWKALNEEQRKSQPQAGDLFRLKTNIKGREKWKFAG